VIRHAGVTRIDDARRQTGQHTMDAALIELSAAAPRQRLDTDRMRDILLLRLAVTGKALTRDGLVKELAPLGAHLIAASDWKTMLERDLAALADAGLADVKASSVGATAAGVKRAAIVLGGRAAFPKTWAEARDVRLIGKVLGLESEPLPRLKKLARPDGLRAAVLVRAFGLKLRGTPSPVRLRTALAKVALGRAFGSSVEASREDRTGLSAKAGRTLAGRLARVPKDFRTDSRLIAGLAADQMDADSLEFSALQLAVLRRYVTKGEAPPKLTAAKPKRGRANAQSIRLAPKPVSSQLVLPLPLPAGAVVPTAQPSPKLPVLQQPMTAARPTLPAFAADVLVLAQPVSEGWAGNRKAFISKLWKNVAQARPHWGLTEFEFKCMLAEAHRTGHLVLANADLKDGRNLSDVQASALSYKNTVFHYVRVDV
jgi:hypothetical protein